jgi:amino acid transporter
MVIGVILYIGLQLAFIGALHPEELKNGWANISFPQDAGPFAGIATVVGVGWLATLIYLDAMISPGGTGLIYIGASSRLSFALGRNHYIPHQAGYLTEGGVPIVSPGMVGARRIHHLGDRDGVRDGATRPRSYEAPGARSPAAVQATGR